MPDPGAHGPPTDEPDDLGLLDETRVLDGSDAGELSAAGSPPPTLSSSAHPQHLGPYRVIEALGQGGMGTVYLAEQEEPVERRVALKVMASFENPLRFERFALECRALAKLSHPNVASLYEVGSTEAGIPYVAMELVEGLPITEWCDHHRLGLHGRLELFVGVCAGVRHAHEKGILHRDIKPSNVMVTEIDGRPTAKVIDFGVARSSEVSEDENRLTRAHEIVGSLHYMSPEAVTGRADVDTRSDVYSLGLLLFELLAGHLPFDTETIGFATFVRRLIDGDFPQPSRRLGELDSVTLEKVAGLRGTTPRVLRDRLGGDLDAIVGQSMAVRRSERYGSPGELAADIERHLAKRPVEARAATLPYVAGLFVRRRLGLVVAVSALVLSLVAGTVISLHEARRANLEAERATLEATRAREAQAEAEQVSRFLVDLFGIVDPEREPDAPVDVRDLLARSEERLDTELADQPLARARLLETISDIHRKLARLDDAESVARAALELRESHLDPEHPDVLSSLNQLGILHRRQGRLDEAETLLRRALDGRERVGDPEKLASALNNLGNLLWQQKRLDEAEEVHRRALALRETHLDPDHVDLARSLNNLGVLLQDGDRYAEAVPYLRRARDIYARTHGRDHPLLGAVLNNLGLNESGSGLFAEAEKQFREALRIWSGSYGDAHPRTLMAAYNLAGLVYDSGRDGEALELVRSFLPAATEIASEHPGHLRRLLSLAGRAAGRSGRLDEAEQHLRQSLDRQLAKSGEESYRVVDLRVELARLELRRGQPEASEEALRILLGSRFLAADQRPISRSTALRYRAGALIGRQRYEEAEALLVESIELQNENRSRAHRNHAATFYQLGKLQMELGRTEEARQSLERAAGLYGDSVPPSQPDFVDTRRLLVELASRTEASE